MTRVIVMMVAMLVSADVVYANNNSWYINGNVPATYYVLKTNGNKIVGGEIVYMKNMDACLKRASEANMNGFKAFCSTKQEDVKVNKEVTYAAGH